MKHHLSGAKDGYVPSITPITERIIAAADKVASNNSAGDRQLVDATQGSAGMLLSVATSLQVLAEEEQQEE